MFDATPLFYTAFSLMLCLKDLVINTIIALFNNNSVIHTTGASYTATDKFLSYVSEHLQTMLFGGNAVTQ